MRSGSWLASVMAALAGVLTLTGPATVWACSGGQAADKAIPLPGATNVSTETSMVVESQRLDAGLLTLLVNGQPSGPLSLTDLGPGFPRTHFWRVRIGRQAQGEPLQPDAEYVLTAPTPSGGSSELTRFKTGPGYDKAQGQAAVIRGLRLWRVRYPLSDIQSGNCVFAEYHGFITVDYQPAEVPNTAPAAVVHTFSLGPQHGGIEQTMVYAEATPFEGLAPVGEHPAPVGAWHPDLDPTRAHCLTITAFGDGDRARLPVVSNVVCADVVEISATGAPPPPGNGGSNGAGSSGGCSTAGQRTTPTFWTTLALLGIAAARRRRS